MAAVLMTQESEQQQEPRAFFEAAVMRLMKKLYGTAMRLTKNDSDAEDLVADAVTQAWSKFDDLRDWDKFDGWLLRILANTFTSNWRHRKAELELTDPYCTGDEEPCQDAYLYSKLHQPFLLWWSSPEQTFVNELLHDDLVGALDALADGYRVVVVLIEVLGYSYSEAAESLDVPVGTIRSRLNRGRRLLQESLWTQAQHSGVSGACPPQEV